MKCGYRWMNGIGVEHQCDLPKGHEPRNRHQGGPVDFEQHWKAVEAKFGVERMQEMRENYETVKVAR